MMKILNGKLWVGLLIIVVMVTSGIVGDIGWAFASLGGMGLIGMAGIGAYVLAKALQRSDISLKGVCPECGNTSAASFGGDDSKQVTYSKSAGARPISEKDKRLIMEHVNELFAIDQQQSLEESAKAGPISQEDKRLIMAHVGEFFTKGLGQGEEMAL
ncbi:hypothetical protein ACFLWO_03495 [Chloroflexota bacterium]